MRVTVELSDELMQKAMWACQTNDPAEVLTLALETLVSQKLPQRLLARMESYYHDSLPEYEKHASEAGEQEEQTEQ